MPFNLLFRVSAVEICAGQSIATQLSAAIEKSMNDNSKHTWGVHVNIPAAISGTIKDEKASFDAPFIFYEERQIRARIPMVPLVAVFHTPIGGMEGHMASYVATTVTTPGTVPIQWQVTSQITSRGSMGYMYPHPDGTQIFFAYEIESESGNTIAIRLYSDINQLKKNNCYFREVQLERKILIPSGSSIMNEVTVRNIGTPSISKIVVDSSDISIHLRFHYYLEENNPTDLQGKGIVKFPSSGDEMVSAEYKNWQGMSDGAIKDGMRKIGIAGKIGRRAEISDPEGENDVTELLLFEAQLADAGETSTGWLSWRPVLYDTRCGDAMIVPLRLPQNLQTFANPRVSYIDFDYFFISFFVPSEAFDDQDMNEFQTMDKTKCPLCADNPMEKALAPAQAGTFFVVVPVESFFPKNPVAGCYDDPTFSYIKVKGQNKRKTFTCETLMQMKDTKPKSNQLNCKLKKGNCRDTAKTVADCCPLACGLVCPDS